MKQTKQDRPSDEIYLPHMPRRLVGSRDFRKVSAVCTHPHAQGRGYVRARMGRVINRMLRADETPFLHVESTNIRAIDVYLGLGFIRRTEYPLLYAKRVG